MTLATEDRFLIGRHSFDVDTLSAMDEIAALVLAHQSLTGMIKSFRNSPKLDHEEARPYAEAVLSTTRQTAAALQKALFAVKSKRPQKIAAVRRKFLPVFKDVAPSAKWLAEQESAATGERVIEVMVLRTFRDIVVAWSSSSQ